MKPRNRRNSGFTFVEISTLIVVVSVSSMALSSGIRSSQQMAKTTREETALLDRSEALLSQIRSLEHGPAGVASANQIADIIDRDGISSGSTFPSVRQLAGASPMIWQYAGTDTVSERTWRIEIDSDLNADGDTSDPLEGTDDLLRITISVDGRILLHGVSGRDSNE